MIKFDLEKNGRSGIISGDFFDDIREHFSEKNDGARFARMRGRFVPSRTYAITPGGRLDPCLFFEITKFLLNNGHCKSENIIATSDFIKNIRPIHTYNNSIHFTDEPYNNLSLELRDYQKSVVKKCLQSGRGVVVLATAGGKTLIIASLLSNFFNFKKNFKCLLIVPDLGLVSQTYNDFTSYNVKFLPTKWTGSEEPNKTANVIIANLGILQSDKTDLSLIENVDLIIFDEVHKVRRGNKINNILKNIKTQVRFGFTGTMPEGKLDQWNITGKIGPIIYEKNSFQLRQEKFVTNVEANIIKLNYKTYPKILTDTKNPSEKYRAELNFLFDNLYRNNTISSIAANAPNNVLILIDYIKHGEILLSELTKKCKNKKIFFIRGEVEIEDREQVKQLMEKSNNVVCIAISKIFSTGVNIKNLHFIIFAGGGKAKIKTLQSIGRGLRLHTNKDKLYLIDLADQFTYGKRHQLKRQTFYEQENIPYKIKEINET